MDEKKNNAPVVWDWFDHPQNLRRLRIGFYLVLALLVLADLFLHKHVLFYRPEAWPGFYAAFGFIACVAIILISKLLGYVLKRKEDYYEH
ncbi:MAG: hypothetical protein IH614_02115 [Desulfuromonadales bacterium]|nr:hypothetical protein [Desulfuromonadales bacterium]